MTFVINPYVFATELTAQQILAQAVWRIDADSHDGNTSVENLGTAGTLTGTETGTLKFLTFDTSPGFEYFGLAASHISTADKAALDLDSFDIAVRVRMDDWTPAAITPLVAKFAESAGTDGNRSYYFRVLTGGELSLGIRTAGVNTFYTSTLATGISNGAKAWVRVTRDRSSGDVKFWTAADSITEPGAWSQLGTTVAGSTSAITNSTSSLYVGTLDGTTTHATGCRFFHVLIKNAATAGTLVAEMCAGDAPETGTWDDGTIGNTWTVTLPSTGQGVTLVDRDMWLFDGTDDYIEWADDANFDLPAGSDRAAFAVVRAHSFPSNPILLAKRAGNTVIGWDLYTTVGAVSEAALDDGPSVAQVAQGPTHDGRMATIATNIDLAAANQATVYARGVAGTPVSIVDQSYENTEVFRVGAFSGTASQWGTWRLTAAGVFHRILTAAEWLKVDRYLTSRHGCAPNAVASLTIPTYDSSGEAIHPSVWDFGSPWNGYRYWMAFTPYPGSDEDFENPSIVASNDRVTWVVPPGLTNPIVADPGGSAFNADPELVYDAANAQLVLIYSTYDGSTNKTWYARTSSDGVTWSGASTLFVTAIATENPLSPSVRKTGASEWTMWYINSVASPNTWVTRTSTTATGTYSSATARTVNGIPTGWDLWHACVVEDPGGVYRGVFAMCNRGGNGTGRIKQMVGSAATAHGTWTLRRHVLLTPGVSGRWDDFATYRSSIVMDGDICRMWYSGNNGDVPPVWGTGYTEFPTSAFPTP